MGAYDRHLQMLHPDIVPLAQAHVSHGIEQTGQRAKLSSQFTDALMHSSEPLPSDPKTRSVAQGAMSMGTYRLSTDMGVDVDRAFKTAEGLGIPTHTGPQSSDNDNRFNNKIAVQQHLKEHARNHAMAHGVEVADI